MCNTTQQKTAIIWHVGIYPNMYIFKQPIEYTLKYINTGG